MVSHDPVCMIGLHIFFTIASRKGISISGVLCETDILAGENLGQPRVGVEFKDRSNSINLIFNADRSLNSTRGGLSLRIDRRVEFKD